MRMCMLFALVALALSGATVHAGEVILREEHNGIWGAWKEVGGNANTLGLFRMKNNIPLPKLDELPNGMALAYDDEWLRPGYRPGREAVRLAIEIFAMDDVPARPAAKAAVPAVGTTATARPVPTSPDSETIADLKQKKNDADVARIKVEGALKDANNKLGELRGEIKTLKSMYKILADSKEPTAAAEALRSVRGALRSRPFWQGVIGAAAVAAVIFFMAMVWYLLRGRKSPANTQTEDGILRQPLELRAVSPNGTEIIYPLSKIVMPAGGGDGEPRWKCPMPGCWQTSLKTTEALSPAGHMGDHPEWLDPKPPSTTLDEDDEDEMVLPEHFDPRRRRSG